MIGRNKEIFRLFGFRITVDPLLPIIILLLAWVLSDRYFPRYLLGLETWQYVAMGLSSALLLIVSIFIHELGHARMARWFGLPTERIHLFLLGGMAELKYRPTQPSHEAWIAIAGPVSSVIFAATSYVFAESMRTFSLPLAHVLYYNSLMNGLLAAFNIVPIFPLDGGRALRGILWHRVQSFYEASRLTFKISSNLIALLFILSFVSWFWFDPMWTLWIAVFALYMMYTALNGRRELVRVPQMDDLIFQLKVDTTEAFIEHIRRADPDYLKEGIVPYLKEGEFNGVIFGRCLTERLEISMSFEESLEIHDPVVGTYIDVSLSQTFAHRVEYKAAFVPVFHHGRLLGLCDPHELRFWLRETARFTHIQDAGRAYFG
jgi:Zn-dependent protease